MAARTKPFVETLLGILLVVGAIVLVMSYQNTSLPQPPVLQKPTPTPAQNREVHSADGKMSLAMTGEGKKDGPKKYSFFVSEVLGKNKKTLFEQTVEATASMMLSPNSWSPDNKYLFIQQKQGSIIDSFVFKASGEPFANEVQYLDVRALFEGHKTKYTFKDATGWDDPVLLHVTTMLDANTKGPSYWFEVPSKAFLQLATR